MSEPMMGQIMAFGGNYNPQNWAFCNGSLVSINQYTALFSIVGTLYGGDGRTTFGLPDLRGRSPLGMGDGPTTSRRSIGQQGGAESVTLSDGQMPNHTHALSDATLSGSVSCTAHVYDGEGTAVKAEGAMLAEQTSAAPDGSKVYSRSASPTVDMNSNFISTTHDLAVSGQVSAAGGSAGHPNMHPWMCLNYIIALEGYYPPRS